MNPSKYLTLALFLLILEGCAIFRPSTINGAPINEIPMYGGVKKSPQMEMADREFVNRMLNSYHNGNARDSACEFLSSRGWQYLQNGDAAAAIKRFNQCWLIDSTNGLCVWGFGSYEGYIGNYNNAIAYLEKAAVMLPNDFSLETDLASGYAQKALENKADRDTAGLYLEKARVILENVSKAHPKDEKVFCRWAEIEAINGNPDKACELISKCKDENGNDDRAKVNFDLQCK